MVHVIPVFKVIGGVASINILIAFSDSSTQDAHCENTKATQYGEKCVVFSDRYSL